MDATTNFSLRLAQASESKAETPDGLLKTHTLQRIATGISLVSSAIGFSVLGTLIIVNRDQADLNSLCFGRSIAMVSGIRAILVGAVFLVIACLHWRVSARRSVAFPAGRPTARRCLDFHCTTCGFVVAARAKQFQFHQSTNRTNALVCSGQHPGSALGIAIRKENTLKLWQQILSQSQPK
jgi:hypothetical protein